MRFPKPWEEIGPFTMNVAREATQTNGIPTQGSGRVSALAVDPKCTAGSCRLYLASAGGGVWRTDNALSGSPNWKSINIGIDSASIGTIVLDQNDKSGKTLYAGTGEPNGSSDNEAGVGLYKSTDRGDSWSLVSGSVAVAKDRGIGAVAIDPADPSHIFIGTAVARHGSSSSNGGRYTPPGAPLIGLYESKDGGATFTANTIEAQDTVNPASPNGSDFFRGGVTDIEYDPSSPSTFYFTMIDYGVYRSSDNGATTQRIYTAVPDEGGIGIRYQLATAKPTGGKTRIYLYEGSNEATDDDGALVDASKVYRTNDARAAAVAWENLSSATDGTPGFSSFDICGGQCSYDMPIASPPGKPDEVWIGGQTQYGELPPYFGADRSNGRNVMRSVNGGAPAGAVQFTDMTGDARTPFEDGHPDIHEFAFVPNSGIAFIGSDGGMIRTSGTYVNNASACDSRGLGGVDLQDCHTWLSSIPSLLTTMNEGLRTVQFQSVSVNPSNPLGDVIGGTQDNGTLGYSGSGTWLNFVSGDSGQSGIDAANGNIRYHTYFSTQGDVNFHGNDPQGWDWIFDPILFSFESASFYVPFIADPVVSKTAYTGATHVWRTQSAGGDQAFLENHCSVLGGPKSDALNTGASSGCGDWVKLGTPSLTGSAYGATKGTGYVVATTRSVNDANTLWAGTRRGRLFVSKNANVNDAAGKTTAPDPLETGTITTQSDVTFDRIDTDAQPQRFISGVSLDASDTTGNTAYVSFSGYDAYTPATPGHVFKVVYNPATHTAAWTNLSYDLGDQPITDVEVDSLTGDLYASTDFGVNRLPSGQQSWIPAADGLPPVAVYGLTLANGGKKADSRVLYAATHGRGAWRISLPKSKQDKNDNR